MQRLMLTAKIHRATVTRADLNYEGSLSIDEELMEAVGILPFEQVKVYNINNGERFDTYAIKGEKGSGIISLNGAAARKGHVGDLIIIVSYCFMKDTEIGEGGKDFQPKVILLDSDNKIIY
jgi:aspartate 1-decarboxylase